MILQVKASTASDLINTLSYIPTDMDAVEGFLMGLQYDTTDSTADCASSFTDFRTNFATLDTFNTDCNANIGSKNSGFKPEWACYVLQGKQYLNTYIMAFNTYQ